VDVNLPAKVYTENDLARARGGGKLVGWIQGAGVVIVASMVFNLLGWIPTIAVVGGVGYLAYKLLSRSSKKEEGVEE
jgi:MFS superfamily sulfate permease-like transporter